MLVVNNLRTPVENLTTLFATRWHVGFLFSKLTVCHHNTKHRKGVKKERKTEVLA